MVDSAKPLKRKYAKIASYKKIFSTDEGREVLSDLMNVHNVLSSTFDINANVMALREGERNVVLRIMTILKITPKEMQALAEEIERNVRADADPNDPNADNSSRINW